MKHHPSPGATRRARSLRRNATEAEKLMWRLLRENFPQAKFRRQVPLRQFIVDLASHRERLVLEIDGGQHSLEADQERTAVIEAEGYRVLRFWNNEVLGNGEGVLMVIGSALHADHPHLSSPIKGEE